MKNAAIFILFTIFLTFANDHVSKLTWGATKDQCDSVVLSDPPENDMPFYSTISIYRKSVKIYSYHDSSVEIDGNDIIFTEHILERQGESQLIFRCSGRPGDDYFFVIQKNNNGYVKLGYTPNSSAEIFGDIDYDGIFEIGGFENFHEGGSTTEETIKIAKGEYKIFKVLNKFPVDTLLTNKLLPIVINNYKKKLGLTK
jgi:hypothetical protein